MSEPADTSLNLLTTGVPGLDEVLGGGLPEYSFNVIAGPPGSGKTTLAHQIGFANATPARPTLYFAVLGEPPLKMLRYQQRLGFFCPEKLGTAIRFIDLSAEILAGRLDRVLAAISEHVRTSSPSMVVVDSFRTVMAARPEGTGTLEAQGFLQRLALQLTSWEVTSCLVGEYGEEETCVDPVFTIADGIIWLTQARERSAVVRQLEVMKLRGQASVPGRHTFRISSGGVQVYFQNPPPVRYRTAEERVRRLRTGVPGLDELLGGGIPLGDVTLVGGPSGTGKTALSTHFIAQGVKEGEPGVLALFEEKPDEYLLRAREMGFDLEGMVRANKLAVLHLRSPDLSADQALFQILEATVKLGARRLVVDSLNGLELALAPHYRDDFREALYRLVGGLTSGGATVLLTVEVAESFDQIRFSPHGISFMTQNIMFLRYIEIEGRLRKVLAVVKMRRSRHADRLHAYEITDTGMRIEEALQGYQGILTGNPTPIARPMPTSRPDLTALERLVLERLHAAGRATEAALIEATQPLRDQLVRAIERLVDLNEVITLEEAGETVYRPAD